MFDLADAARVLMEVNACRKAHSDCYVKLNAYDASSGRQTTATAGPGRHLDEHRSIGAPRHRHDPAGSSSGPGLTDRRGIGAVIAATDPGAASAALSARWAFSAKALAPSCSS